MRARAMTRLERMLLSVGSQNSETQFGVPPFAIARASIDHKLTRIHIFLRHSMNYMIEIGFTLVFREKYLKYI